MIKLNKYDSAIEDDYFEAVNKRVPTAIQNIIVKDCKNRFFVNDFGDDFTFESLVLMSFNTMKKVVESKCDIHIDLSKAYCDIRDNDQLKPYNTYRDTYKLVAEAQKVYKTMRVRLVDALGITVCPYCNRDYINARSEGASGAQLDHFYSKEDYPYLALSLYNLIPVCGNCNRIKSKKKGPFASVFDEDIDFNKDLIFDYSRDFSGIEMLVHRNNEALKNNITEMRIKYAYQIHSKEAKELKELHDAYRSSQVEEIREVLRAQGISDEYIKRIIFGPNITEEDMKTKPLGKMMSDLHKKLGVYE